MDVELKLLNIIIENEKINQRAIAKNIGLSLGTVNSMLRNLETRQYLYINKTKHNSAMYGLTDQGRAYRCEKMYEYLIECSETVMKIRTNIRNLLLAMTARGVRNFYLSEREDEFYRIVMLILMEISRKADAVYHLSVPEQVPDDGLILGWKSGNEYQTHEKYLHLIQKI